MPAICLLRTKIKYCLTVNPYFISLTQAAVHRNYFSSFLIYQTVKYETKYAERLTRALQKDTQKYRLSINTCSEMEACEVTLLVPLLLALRGSVTECLVISCDLTEGYCCSFPSLEGLVHLLKKNSEGWRYRAIRNKVFSIRCRWKQFMLTTYKKV